MPKIKYPTAYPRPRNSNNQQGLTDEDLDRALNYVLIVSVPFFLAMIFYTIYIFAGSDVCYAMNFTQEDLAYTPGGNITRKKLPVKILLHNFENSTNNSKIISLDINKDKNFTQKDVSHTTGRNVIEEKLPQMTLSDDFDNQMNNNKIIASDINKDLNFTPKNVTYTPGGNNIRKEQNLLDSSEISTKSNGIITPDMNKDQEIEEHHTTEVDSQKIEEKKKSS